MKRRNIITLIVTSVLFLSCDSSNRGLGGDFVLYKGDVNYPWSIGLEVGGGGVQGLFDGDIVAYGYDDGYITVKVGGDKYYYFDKAKIAANRAEPTNRGEGPFSGNQFNEIIKTKNLPSPTYVP